MQAPHERSSLSPAQYSRWLDQHSVEDVARGVAAALDAARDSIGGMQDAGQRHVLAVMGQLCAVVMQQQQQTGGGGGGGGS